MAKAETGIAEIREIINSLGNINRAKVSELIDICAKIKEVAFETPITREELVEPIARKAQRLAKRLVPEPEYPTKISGRKLTKLKQDHANEFNTVYFRELDRLKKEAGV